MISSHDDKHQIYITSSAVLSESLTEFICHISNVTDHKLSIVLPHPVTSYLSQAAFCTSPVQTHREIRHMCLTYTKKSQRHSHHTQLIKTQKTTRERAQWEAPVPMQKPGCDTTHSQSQPWANRGSPQLAGQLV